MYGLSKNLKKNIKKLNIKIGHQDGLTMIPNTLLMTLLMMMSTRSA
jgi:hypothetical protein